MKLLFVQLFYTLQVSNYPFTNMLCVHKNFNREGTMWLAKKALHRRAVSQGAPVQ